MQRWLSRNRTVGWFIDYWPGDWQMTWFDTRRMWSQRLSGWIVCPIRNHEWYSDMCGRREHDRCIRCDERRDRVEC